MHSIFCANSLPLSFFLCSREYQDSPWSVPVHLFLPSALLSPVRIPAVPVRLCCVDWYPTADPCRRSATWSCPRSSRVCRPVRSIGIACPGLVNGSVFFARSRYCCISTCTDLRYTDTRRTHSPSDACSCLPPAVMLSGPTTIATLYHLHPASPMSVAIGGRCAHNMGHGADDPVRMRRTARDVERDVFNRHTQECWSAEMLMKASSGSHRSVDTDAWVNQCTLSVLGSLIEGTS